MNFRMRTARYTRARMEVSVGALLEGLEPVVRSRAEGAERARRMPPEVIAAFHHRRLFRLWIPRTFGGLEWPLPPSLELFEEVSRWDGAAGWTAAIGVGGGPFAAYMDPRGAHDVFGPESCVIAGSGKPSGRAAVAPGGYVASGAWRYASGAHHATWFTANCFVTKDGAPVLDASGEPLIRAMAFPAATAAITETWDVEGMRATGSHDFAIETPQFVPEERTFSVFTDLPYEPGPLYRFPFVCAAEVSFGAVGLGLGRGAIDAFLGAVDDASHGVPLAERAPAQVRLAEAEALVRSARAWFHEVANDAWATVERNEPLSPRQLAMVKLASVHATASGVRAADLLTEVSGMAPLFASSLLGRAARDARTLRAHVSVRPAGGYEDAGRQLLAGDG